MELSETQPISDITTPFGDVIDPTTDRMIKAICVFAFRDEGRLSKAFDGASRQEIIYSIVHHVKNRHISVFINSDMTVGGFILFTPDGSRKRLHIAHMVSDGGVCNGIETACKVWLREFKGWDVTAIRHGRLKTYKFDDFFENETLTNRN